VGLKRSGGQRKCMSIEQISERQVFGEHMTVKGVSNSNDPKNWWFDMSTFNQRIGSSRSRSQYRPLQD
jgi:hypothetical protein